MTWSARQQRGESLALTLVDGIAPKGYMARLLGGWCVYEGCQVKHAEDYDNTRCPLHRGLKNKTNRASMLSARKSRVWRRVQLGLFADGC